jgi:hypothetical protein
MADDGWIAATPAQPAASDDGWVKAAPAGDPAFTGSSGLDVAKTVYPQLGPILSAFGHGAKDGWGDTPLGLPPDAVEWLSKKGIFGPDKGGFQGVAGVGQAFNELLAHTVVGAAQIVGRTGSALLGSYQAGVAETGEQVGQPQLGRDLAAMPEAFFGSPHPMGIPKILPGAAAPGIGPYEGPLVVARKMPDGEIKYGKPGDVHADLMTRKELNEDGPTPPKVEQDMGFAVPGGEFMSRQEALDYATKHEPERAAFSAQQPQFGLEASTYNEGALPPALAEARDLGVIGPPKPDMAGASPAARADAEVPKPAIAAAARTGDSISEPVGGPEKAGNIRLDQIGINSDAKEVILDAAKNNDDFNQARSGNVPLAQVESLSNASGVPSETLTGNDGLGRLMHNDAVVRTWLQAFHQASDEIAEQMSTVARTGDEPDVEKLRDMTLRFQHMQEQVSGLTAEAGRTLGVFREFYANKGKAEAIGKLLEDNPGLDADSLKKLADAGKGLDKDQVPRFLHDSRQPTFWDKYLYYWVNALISGPVTHAKYIGANAAFGAYEAVVTTPIAGALGAVRRGLSGGTEGVYMGEAAARTWGLIAGTPDALKAAWTAAKNNVMTPFENEVAGKQVNPLTQIRPGAIGGKLGFALGVPGRSAAGIHSFFRFLGYRAEIEARAYRMAAKEGLSPVASGAPPVADGYIRFYHGEKGQAPTAGGPRWFTPQENYARHYNSMGEENTVHYVDVSKADAITHGGYDEINSYPQNFEAPEHIAKQAKPLEPTTTGDSFWERRAWHADNPTDETMNAGIDNGNHLTFIGEQGTFGKAISRLANTRFGESGIQPFKLILPFTHIPGQILRAGLELTPAAFVDAKMRADLLGKNGAVAADTQRARLIGGGAVSAMVANYAVNDTVTGSGPTDPAERARWLRTHEPYSVRLGGWWYSYNKFGPIGDLVGLVANLVEVGPKVKDAEYADAAGHVIKATARMLEDEVGMQGLVNLIDALGDPDRKMGRFVAGQAASNLPYSSLLRQTASFNDPQMREAKTFVDQLRYATPWARQDLLPKRDWLGQPMDNPGYESIIRQRAVNADPVDVAVSQLRGFKPAPPQDRIGGVKLPPKLYDEYQTTAGAMAKAGLDVVVRAPGWGEIPPGIREQIVHSMVEKARQTAGSMLQAKHPEIIMQGLSNRQDKITGQKPTKLQDSP